MDSRNQSITNDSGTDIFVEWAVDVSPKIATLPTSFIVKKELTNKKFQFYDPQLPGKLN